MDFFFPLFNSTPHFKAQKRAGFHFWECFQHSEDWREGSKATFETNPGMQRLRGLRAWWTCSTGWGLCQQRQGQPVHNVQMPSLNLATGKSGNAEMKGLPCSRYQGLPQTSAQAAQGGPGCFAHHLFCSTHTPPPPPYPFFPCT